LLKAFFVGFMQVDLTDTQGSSFGSPERTIQTQQEQEALKWRGVLVQEN